MAPLRKVVTRARALHYLDIFLAATLVSLAANSQHLMDAHGLNALKSAGVGALIAGGKAVLEAYRKSTRRPDQSAADRPAK